MEAHRTPLRCSMPMPFPQRRTSKQVKWVVFALLALLVRIGAVEGERSLSVPGNWIRMPQ